MRFVALQVVHAKHLLRGMEVHVHGLELRHGIAAQILYFVLGHLCAGDTGVPKAETLGIAIEKWKLRSPVYVGDTAGDEASAGAAGMPFIHAAYGFGTAVRPACVISSPGELPGILDSPELRK